MTDCLCLECRKRFICDFFLTAWAAKARALNNGLDVEFIVTKCDNFGDPFNMGKFKNVTHFTGEPSSYPETTRPTRIE